MTGSWAIDTFIIGCTILMVIPLVVYIHKEMLTTGKGEINDI